MSRRVRAAEAAAIVGIAATTLHRWVRQGRLRRYPDGYDLAELLAAEQSRDEGALRARAGIKGNRPARRIDKIHIDDTPSP
jgi:transposase-like protein